jgi:hypothetical protein
MSILPVFALILGIIILFYPKQMFMFGRRWQFKEGSEPNDGAIFFV